MQKSKKKKRDPLPEQFNSAEEAGEFWDTHSGADYEEYMIPVEAQIELKPRINKVSVAPELLAKTRKIARQQGLTTETLINLWLQEKIAAHAG